MPQQTTDTKRTISKSPTKDMSNAAGSVKEASSDFLSTATEVAQDYKERASEMARQAGEETVGFVRRHPINVAIGAACVGLLAGYFLAKRRS